MHSWAESCEHIQHSASISHLRHSFSSRFRQQFLSFCFSMHEVADSFAAHDWEMSKTRKSDEKCVQRGEERAKEKYEIKNKNVILF